jgi:hypothetical protein
MGGLVKRLAPFTSNRRVAETSDAVSRVRQALESAKARLEEHGLRVEIKANVPIEMHNWAGTKTNINFTRIFIFLAGQRAATVLYFS